MLLSTVLRRILPLVLLPIVAFSQASIRGSVTDQTTNEPLVGAHVFVQGTAIGTATDREGKYVLTGVPAGSYQLKVSYIGYVSKEISQTVESGSTMSLDITLMADVVQGEEVIVTAQARGQVAAINQQRTSNTIINVISEEKIQELPDANAAEAIGRLPGVSLIRSGGEANKVLLRGLSDKFSTITIDGIKVPPTDANERGVDLSTISQGTLAGVELFKALTPDKDADAIAGSINLVTKRAPQERVLKADLKGDYNHLMKALDQYDVQLKYGERFFDNLLGVQFNGNLERRVRSNERYNIDYTTYNGGRSFEISNLLLEFTDEIRSRNGVGLLLDIDLAEDNTIRLNTIYSGTKRDYLYTTRNYPSGTGTAGLVTYNVRDREQDINTFNTSLHGDNSLSGFTLVWSLSYAQSISDYPYDYDIDFLEPSIFQNGIQVSGMRTPPQITSNPEIFIDYALNNYNLAYSNWAYFRTSLNEDRERTASLNASRKYSLGDLFIGELTVGGKYKSKSRMLDVGTLYSPYYLGYWRDHTRLDDGTIVEKDFTGTAFDAFYQRFLLSNRTARTPFASDFLDNVPGKRNIYDIYTLQPLFNRDKVRLWYELNRRGTDQQGGNSEYYNDPTVAAGTYDINERVTAGFLMNTLNIGQNVTFIAGVRVESEDNDYRSKYSPSSLGGFPVGGIIKDTTANHTETIWLPNFHVTFRPTESMNIRLAAFRALARPDFNLRLEKYIAQGGGGTVGLTLGNPHLRTAKAWNYEINASLFDNTVGLVSVSAFYKEISDMYHLLNGAGVMGNYLLDSLGIGWDSPFVGGTQYSLTVPYNSSKPTKVWGLEFEHQMNFSFFPGFLKNLVLSWNASLVRSETHLIATEIETTYTFITIIPGFPPQRVPSYNNKIVDRVQKLEGQPEFYGNVSLGYDYDGFSARISVFHQGEFNTTLTASGLNDVASNSFTRVDLALKQAITEGIALMVNVNNITDEDESTSTINRSQGWRLLNTSERYGTTVDVGVRVTL